MYGSIEVIPLQAGMRATLELRPTRLFDMGLGEPGRGVTAEAEGGVLGLVIDARGRPLDLPAETAKCRALAQEWLGSLGIGEDVKDKTGDLGGWLREAARQHAGSRMNR
jgi:hypothetical protein